jgi:hypothetical protein
VSISLCCFFLSQIIIFPSDVRSLNRMTVSTANMLTFLQFHA